MVSECAWAPSWRVIPFRESRRVRQAAAADRRGRNGGDMKHATSMALHAYWQGCRGRTGVSAGQIRAVELAPILPSLFLIELNLPAGARFRFCGATIATRYGRDLTQESFLALWNAEDRELLE